METEDVNLEELTKKLINFNVFKPELESLLNYFKYENRVASKIILKHIFYIVININNDNYIFKETYESFLISDEFIKTLSIYFLNKFDITKPDILCAKVLLMICHISFKTDKLCLLKMERTHCLDKVLLIFKNCIDMFKKPTNSIRWTDSDKNIFYIIWKSLPILFNTVIANKIDVYDGITPTSRFIFLEAVKFCKMYLTGEIILNGWEADSHIGIFDYIYNVLKNVCYLKLLHQINGIELFVRSLSNNVETRIANCWAFQSYTLKILCNCVEHLPETLVDLQIIHQLFYFMYINHSTICYNIYHQEKYCVLQDICYMLESLLTNTRKAVNSYEFNKAIKFLEFIINLCDEKCISKVFGYRLILIIKDIYCSPQRDENEVRSTLDEMCKQMDLIMYHRKCLNVNTTESGFNFIESVPSPNVERLNRSPIVDDDQSSLLSPEYDSSSSSPSPSLEFCDEYIPDSPLTIDTEQAPVVSSSPSYSVTDSEENMGTQVNLFVDAIEVESTSSNDCFDDDGMMIT